MVAHRSCEFHPSVNGRRNPTIGTSYSASEALPIADGSIHMISQT